MDIAKEMNIKKEAATNTDNNFSRDRNQRSYVACGGNGGRHARGKFYATGKGESLQ